MGTNRPIGLRLEIGYIVIARGTWIVLFVIAVIVVTHIGVPPDVHTGHGIPGSRRVGNLPVSASTCRK